MNSENVLKEIVKSFIDLENIAKGLMNGNQQPSAQQELERLFPSTRGRRRGGESRELHRVGASEPSASTTTDIYFSNTVYHKMDDCKNMESKIL